MTGPPAGDPPIPLAPRAPAATPAPAPVIAPARGQESTAEPWAPRSDDAVEPVVGWGEQASTGSRMEPRRDFGAAARRRVGRVGSRAREAILGYGFPTTPGTTAGVLPAGEEPAPGQTVVLVGDDVEAWVRERLYGGRVPDR